MEVMDIKSNIALYLLFEKAESQVVSVTATACTCTCTTIVSLAIHSMTIGSRDHYAFLPLSSQLHPLSLTTL